MLKNLLFEALKDHVRCKNCLQQAIETGVCNPPSSMIRQQTMCEFGQWLHSIDLSDKIVSDVYYKTVLDVHAEFHESAANVMAKIEIGEIANAEEMTSIDGQYTLQANRLRTEILNWAQSLDE